MAVLEILKYPHPLLKKRSQEIEKIDENTRHLIQDMIETMYQAPGIGLAANQVGRPVRLIVFDVTQKENGRNPSVLINPEIIETEGDQTVEEGCLSVPDLFSDVKRSAKVKIRGIDAKGNSLELCGEGMLATVLQHEIDHLDGILFIDRLSSLKRALYKKRLQRKMKAE